MTHRYLVGRYKLLAAGLVLVVIIGCTSLVGVMHLIRSKPDGYLWTDSTHVDFMQFTEDSSGHITGSLQSVYTNADDTVSNENAAFTGIENDSQLTLTFSSLGLSTTFTGTLDGDTLTLHFPDQNGYETTAQFHGASISDYNNAAAQLRQKMAANAVATQSAQATVTEQQIQAQTTAAEQQAQASATASAQASLDQTVTDANNQLASDLGSMNADVHTLQQESNFTQVLTEYSQTWQQMQTDYQREQSDYNQGCGPGGVNAGTVQADAGTVEADFGSIQADDGSFQATESPFQSTYSQLTADIKAVQTDWSSLQAALSADTTDTVGTQFSASQVNTAISAAQKQLNTSNQALQSAQGQVKQYDQEAAQMNTDAQNLANSMHC